MKKIFFFFLFVKIFYFSFSQSQTKYVLFIGNSYTYVNDLPKMVSDIALSMGDTLIYDSNAPGGYTLEAHSTNSTTLDKIAEGFWDAVVLQEQSQIPSFPIAEVEADCFPYAAFLDSTINANNNCAETVFFMTWGRKNGDAINCPFWPPVCTYEGMDSLLHLRYQMMAEENNAVVSPVGATWNFVRANYPSIELYQADESHPSVAGTYAAACTFYTILFRKNPILIPFISSLSLEDAEHIKNAAKTIVFDSLNIWNVGKYDPTSSFSFDPSGEYEITCTNTSNYAENYSWDFGDGIFSIEENPVHTYLDSGLYTVKLVSEKCGLLDTSSQTITIEGTDFIQTNNHLFKWQIFPNPTSSTLNISTSIEGKINYKIISTSGNEVLSGEFIKKENMISILDLNSGIFLIQLFKNENKIGQVLFIKL